MSRITEAERGSNGDEGGNPLQIGRRPGHGPQLDGRKGEDRDGADEKPCDAAKEDFRSHENDLTDPRANGHGSFGLFIGQIDPQRWRANGADELKQGNTSICTYGFTGATAQKSSRQPEIRAADRGQKHS